MSAPSEFDVARETGRAHAEYTSQLLTDTPADRRQALTEGARIRLGRHLVDAGTTSEALDAAFAAFDDTIKDSI